MQDVHHGVRTMLRAPAFTIITVAVLALGIGANTAIFSVIDAVLLRPLAYRDSDRLVTILMGGDSPVSVANYIDWRDQSHSFESLEATRGTTLTLTGAGEPERLNARMATAGGRKVLAARRARGRKRLSA